MFNPCFVNEESEGLFPVTSSNNSTPKLYTSDFIVARPLCRYSAFTWNTIIQLVISFSNVDCVKGMVRFWPKIFVVCVEFGVLC